MANEEYEELDKIAISIYLDYEIKRFPIKVMSLCKKMKIELEKYSSYKPEDRPLLYKKSDDGFYFPVGGTPKIVYNDIDHGRKRIRMTIGHEIKHYVCGDVEDDPEKDPLATHFARYLLCPTPILIYLGIDDEYTIMETFDISYSAAKNALKAANNRREKCGDKIFSYEKPLIELFKWMKDDD